MSVICLTRHQIEVLYNEVERFYLEDQPAEFDRGLVLSADDTEVRIGYDDDGNVFVVIES